MIERTLKELTDEVEQVIKTMVFQKGKWRLGIRYNDPYWRVILQMDELEYDIALPGLYKDDIKALEKANKLTWYFVHKSTQEPLPN